MGEQDDELLAVDGALLGQLLDKAHATPPGRIPALIARESSAAGLADVRLYLQDYDQLSLMPLPSGPDDAADPLSIDGTIAGRVFMTTEPADVEVDGGTRLWLPMLDGSDRVGVIGMTVGEATPAARRLAYRVAGLAADLIVTKGSYTDTFFRVRRRRATSLSAEMQWHLLPPLTLDTDVVAVAGALEPAYQVGGDAFDYALNDDVLHVGIFDAMGHGLRAATICGVTVSAYRHARRNGITLVEKYQLIDSALAEQFGDGQFATAQLGDLDLCTGTLHWINAGHPRPLLIRNSQVIRALQAEPTLPIGLGGERPELGSEQLEPGDRVLFFTDGVVEQLASDGLELGFTRLSDLVERECAAGVSVVETGRRLTNVLLKNSGRELRDDATLLLVEWKRRAR